MESSDTVSVEKWSGGRAGMAARQGLGDPILCLPLSCLTLPTRAINAMARNNIRYVGDFVQLEERDMRLLEGVGLRAQNVVREAICALSGGKLGPGQYSGRWREMRRLAERYEMEVRAAWRAGGKAGLADLLLGLSEIDSAETPELTVRNDAEESCASCRFWRASASGDEIGHCRRRSPLALGALDEASGGADFGWPQTRAEAWCGDYTTL